MSLTNQEQHHYNRHIILDEIGESGQLKLKQAKVLVIGAGGLGCPILQYLTAAGVGTLGIIDHDVVDQSNLQRQVLYSYNSIGKYKAEVAATTLSDLNPNIEFEVYLQKLTKDIALELFSRYDIIVDGSDNFPTRYLVNDAAVLTNRPVVFGSIFKFEGQVSVFNWNNGPTYRCLYPKAPKPDSVPNCSETGVVGVLPGIIGALQANEVIKLICEIGDVLCGKLLTFDALSMRQMVLNYSKNDTLNITALEDDYEELCGLPKLDFDLTFSEIEAKLSDYNLLDVREDWEHAQYNIGGQHIPLGDLQSRFKEVKQDKSLVVYCKAGVRSKMAIDILKAKGASCALINLKGGVFSI